MRPLLPAIVLLGLMVNAVAASADTVTLSGVSTFTISPSADTYGLSASSSTVSSGGTVLQAGSFYLGHSGSLVEDIPFSFTEAVTVDGITNDVTFTGYDNVTLAFDELTIAALGPVAFGSSTLDFANSVSGEVDSHATYPCR